VLMTAIVQLEVADSNNGMKPRRLLGRLRAESKLNITRTD